MNADIKTEASLNQIMKTLIIGDMQYEMPKKVIINCKPIVLQTIMEQISMLRRLSTRLIPCLTKNLQHSHPNQTRVYGYS